MKSYQSSYGWDGKIALFGKALVGALARGALSMCAMWVEFPSSFSRVGRKKQNKFMQFALTYQRAKSFLNLILSISYLSGRLSFYTCCQRLYIRNIAFIFTLVVVSFLCKIIIVNLLFLRYKSNYFFLMK
ncbi:MAG: hypothetical protein PHC83_06130 [Bacteroidales bacterium]|nr:hypothetical protein [Bacteroidales bacterium]